MDKVNKKIEFSLVFLRFFYFYYIIQLKGKYRKEEFMIASKGRGKLSDDELIRRKEIADRLNALKSNSGLTQIEISSGSGVPQNTLSRYLNGKSTPKDIYLQKLADFFRVPVSDIDPRQTTPTISTGSHNTSDLHLVRLTDNYAKLDDKRRYRLLVASDELVREQIAERREPVDIADTVIAFSSSKEKYYDYDFYDQAISAGTGQYLGDVQKETISLPIKVDADFVVPVYGDSMEPEYYSGDYVFVKLSIDLDDGEIGVFKYYGDAYIKQLIIGEDGAYLHSFNTKKYSDIPIDRGSDFRIIGEVVDVYRTHQ